MAWQPDYLTASQFKTLANITDTADDAAIGFAITAASRAIDNYCGRQFGKLSTAAARYYEAFYDGKFRKYVVLIDDLMSTTNLVVKYNDEDFGTYDTTITVDTDFRLFPLNAAADNRPWTQLWAETLPTRKRSVEVTAIWGWSAVPGEVTQACVIQSLRYFMRKVAPFGVLGSPDMGGAETRLLSKLDPDVEQLLKPLRRHWGAIS